MKRSKKLLEMLQSRCEDVKMAMLAVAAFLLMGLCLACILLPGFILAKFFLE